MAHTSDKGQDASPDRPGRLKLMILCAAFFANEITVTYELIYMVAVESLLSLPTAYVSLPGVVASAVTFLIVPFIGRYTDRGARYKRRSAMVLVSGALQFFGPLLLLIACIGYLFLELEEQAAYNQCLDVQGRQNESIAAGNMSADMLVYCQYPQNVISPWAATVALISFSVMAVGFDIGTSSIRSFILDSVPVEAHSTVLSVGVMISSLGGCIFALLGLVDFGVLIGWDDEPTLVRSLFLSTFLMISVLVTVPTTLLMGRKLKHSYPSIQEQNTDIKMENIDDSKTKTEKTGASPVISKYGAKEDIVPYNALFIDDDDNMKLVPHDINNLHKADDSARDFRSINDLSYVEDKNGISKKAGNGQLPKQGALVESLNGVKNEHSLKNLQNGHRSQNNGSKSLTQNGEGITLNSTDTPRHYCKDYKSIDCVDANGISESKHLANSVSESSGKTMQITETLKSCHSTLKRWMAMHHYRLLALICLLTFFSSGTSISFEVYFSTFLSEAVYGGDPEAPLGTEAKQRYDAGTMAASRGTLVFMATFFAYNFAHGEVAHRIGCIYEYLIITILAMPTLLAMAITKEVIVFYAVAFLNGIYRTVLFTTPFVMATELIDKENETMSEELYLMAPGTEGTEEKSTEKKVETDSEHAHSDLSGVHPHMGCEGNTKYGATISLVGAMIPLSDLVLSSLMGPLLDAFDDATLPMYISASFGIAAGLVLVVAAFYKKRGWEMEN